MSRLVVRGVAVSVDGYSTGPSQSLEHHLGLNGPELMEWFFHTRVWRDMQGQAGGDACAYASADVAKAVRVRRVLTLRVRRLSKL
jgi:hypothetical protein